MADWISFLLVAGFSGLFSFAAIFTLVVGPAVSTDRWWIAPAALYAAISYGLACCAVELAPFTVQAVNRG